MFHKYDRDHSGCVETYELRGIFRDMGKTSLVVDIVVSLLSIVVWARMGARRGCIFPGVEIINNVPFVVLNWEILLVSARHLHTSSLPLILRLLCRCLLTLRNLIYRMICGNDAERAEVLKTEMTVSSLNVMNVA